MSKNMLESKGVKEKIAKAAVGGESQTSIAHALGVSQSTIFRLTKKEDVRAFIETEALRLLEAVPQAVENLKALLNEMPQIPKRKSKEEN